MLSELVITKVFLTKMNLLTANYYLQFILYNVNCLRPKASNMYNYVS